MLECVPANLCASIASACMHFEWKLNCSKHLSKHYLDLENMHWNNWFRNPDKKVLHLAHYLPSPSSDPTKLAQLPGLPQVEYVQHQQHQQLSFWRLHTVTLTSLQEQGALTGNHWWCCIFLYEYIMYKVFMIWYFEVHFVLNNKIMDKYVLVFFMRWIKKGFKELSI